MCSALSSRSLSSVSRMLTSMTKHDITFKFQVYGCLASIVCGNSNDSTVTLLDTKLNSFKLDSNSEKGFLIRFIHLNDKSYKIELYESESFEEDYKCELYKDICFEKLLEDKRENATLHVTMSLNTTSITL